mgnify:CR=1 FL=1
MVLISFLLVMQSLQILCEVVDALRVEKPPDDIRGLELANGLDVLPHGIVKLPLAVQVI